MRTPDLLPGDLIRCAAVLAAGESLRLAGAGGGVEWPAVEAADGSAGKPRRFTMTGYTGAAMNLGYGSPVVVDLAGLKVPRQDLPILRQHDPERIVGHTDSAEVSPQRVKLAGVVSGTGDAAAEVTATAANGFPWQASIGASADRVERIDPGETVKVNGRVFAGPLYVVRAATLREVSFVPIGADGATSAAVAASFGGFPVDFDTWLKAAGFDPATVTDAQRPKLLAAFQAEQAPKPKDGEKEKEKEKPATTLEQIAAAARLENARRQKITDLAAKYITQEPEQIDPFEKIAEMAITGGWDVQRAELEFMRQSYGRGPTVVTGDSREPTAAVLEAAVCRSAGLKTLDKHFPAAVLEASDKAFRQGIGLKELILTFAQRNGYRGRDIGRDMAPAIKAAMTPTDVRADGPSTYSLPGILSNVQNKFIRDSFNAVESVWRMIAATRPVNDFKAIASYSLTGDLQYKKLAPGGEIRQGTLGEQTYANQADTYAIGLGIDRRDIINDDLGAFQRVGLKLGRGAGLAINDVFWTAYLNNSAFFTSGRGNAFTGAGTALDSSGLASGDANFRGLTDPDGKPLGVMPKILLVPTALRLTALRLMQSQNLIMAGTAGTVTERGEANPFAGMFTVASSVYMSNSAYTGYSAAAWYLLADPAELPVIEVCFLNGIETPTVESSQMEFDQLGIQFRGYHDFGVALQEYRGGIRMAGS